MKALALILLLPFAAFAGTSAPSNVVSVRPGDFINAPTNLVAVATSQTSAKLTWADTSNNEEGFRIERALSASGPWSIVGGVSSNTTAFNDTGLLPATLYFYRVTATNSSPWSAAP